MLNRNTLRNIYKQDFENFFSYHKVKLRSKRIIPNPGEERYIPISRILEEELKSGASFSKEELDGFLYNELFYSVNNWHYLYQLNDSNNAFKNNPESITALLKSEPKFKFNNPLVNKLENENFSLCTSRLEIIDNKVKVINFLFKIGVVESNKENYTFFSGVTIDLERNFVYFRFNQNLLDNYPFDPLDVISKLKDILNGLRSEGRFFEALKFNIVGFNETIPKKIISTLFKDLSSEAEDILNQQVPANTDKDIRDFLKGKKLPSHEDYVQQIKSVIYQDISQTCADTLFKNGWVFRFVFREGQLTRAASRTDDKSPIYGSKVYWHLKELIFKNDEMQEAGFHWYLNDPTQTDEPKFLQARLEARHDSLIIHYYYNMRTGDRKEKEDYVLQKINGYFQ
ncbi:hypothetical protein [Litchfieldia salsa]|uniref:Uncharacterized protein n=1 Tax=Litchfieldia salsa TaxID=930152 RepID=A0A1H0VPL0_9BACI|nr:hypothetical protein [Litchfieldia salsa]SDP80380.1 hypothetical protein SAMN05216565_107127 [Litchfieldia salsa]